MGIHATQEKRPENPGHTPSQPNLKDINQTRFWFCHSAASFKRARHWQGDYQDPGVTAVYGTPGVQGCPTQEGIGRTRPHIYKIGTNPERSTRPCSSGPLLLTQSTPGQS